MKNRDPIIVYGLSDSVYCTIVILVLKQKNVPYQLETLDVFDKAVFPEKYLGRHPFGKIPTFQHGDFQLYETRAIVRYIDDYWPEPSLQPIGVRKRARMEQIISILDSYAYKTMVWDVYVQTTAASKGNEKIVNAGLALSEVCLRAIADLQGSNYYLVRSSLSLADIYAYPMIKYLSLVDQGAELLMQFPNISAWFHSMGLKFDFNPAIPSY